MLLATVVPNTSTLGLWLVLFPIWVVYKLTGKPFLYPRVPEEGKEGLGEVTVLIDSSGSMDQKMYELGASETVHLINQAEPATTHVVEFTTEVIATASYEDGIEIDTMPERRSWGGTDVCIGFDWIQENAPNTTAIIVMSDMEFFTWPDDPGVPVLWVKIPPREDNSWYFGKPSFGKMITVR